MFEKMRSLSKVIVYIVVVSFAIGGGYMGYGAFTGGDGGPAEQEEIDDVLVEVNGQEITRMRFNEVLQNYAHQTANFTRAQMLSFEQNVLNSIIDEALLLSEARTRELDPEVSPEEIDDIIDNILEQNNMELEELESVLAQQNLTLSDLQDDIEQSLRQQNMLEEVMEEIRAEAEVSDEAVLDEYESRYDEDEQQEHDEEEREEITENIREELLDEKQDEYMQQWLEEARAEADIVINDSKMEAMNYFAEEEYTQALNAFEEAMRVSRDPSLFIYKARSHKEMGEEDEALSVLEEAEEEHPEQWEILFEQGEMLAAVDNEEEAVEKYEQASEYAGRNLMARYELNAAFRSIGEDERAQEEMDRFMELQQERQQIAPEGAPEEDIEEVDPDEIEVEPEEEEPIQ